MSFLGTIHYSRPHGFPLQTLSKPRQPTDIMAVQQHFTTNHAVRRAAVLMCLLSFSPAVFSIAPGVFVHTTNEQLQRRQEQHSRDQGRSMSPLADTGSSGLLVIGADGIVTANVRSFGAKGDGRTDDILAIEAALASLNGTGGIVLLPPTRTHNLHTKRTKHTNYTCPC